MYELLYIVPANYTEEELKTITEKINSALKEQGVNKLEQKSATKLKFAYPIKKNTVGFYVLIEFEAEPETLKKLNRALQLEQNILRFMITKKAKEAKEVKLKEFTEIDPTVKKKDQKKEIKKRAPEKDKIKLEEIDKKLDTILEKEIV